MEISRRELLKFAAIGAGAIALPIGELARSAGAGSDRSDKPNSPTVAHFTRALPIPPIAQPVGMTLWEDGTTLVPYYEIRQAITDLEILPGLRTPTMTYAGVTPGPTFRVRRGEKIVVRQVNATGVPTVTHLHGARVKGRYDGHPVRGLVAPGSSFLHYYPNNQPAINMWYHDHAIDHTGRNVYRGLAAMYFLTDDHEQSLNLPSGPFEVPLVLQDKAFNKDGTIFYPTDSGGQVVQQGAFGDVILVNGAPFPVMQVARRKYRFRMLNGSNARFYNLELSTGEPLSVVESDGGLLPQRVDTDQLFLAPAERYGFVIDFSKYTIGTRVVMRNTVAPDPFGDPVDPDKIRDVMAFDVVGDAPDPSSLPDVLNDWPPPTLDPSRSVRTRRWRFERSGGAWVINGLGFDNNRIDAAPALNSTEIWEFVNNSGGWLHPIHAHLVEYKILDRSGRAVQPYEHGPKDTCALGPNQSARVILNFNGDDDFRGEIYVLHCHNLEHEDNMMMTNFTVS